MVVFIFIVLFVMSNILWLLSKKNKIAEISGSYVKGVTRSFWYILVHLLSYNYYISPKTKALKVFTLIWFVLVFVFVLSLASSVTALMTTGIMNQAESIKSSSDLTYKRLAYVEGRNAVNFIDAVHAIPVPNKSAVDALNQLNDGEGNLTGVVDDYMILENNIKKHNLKNVKLSSFILSNDELAFAVPYGSKLLKPLNLGLVKLQDSGKVLNICRHLMPKKFKNCSL
jgi:ABC-type amino acid transport substrate-binding protein